MLSPEGIPGKAVRDTPLAKEAAARLGMAPPKPIEPLRTAILTCPWPPKKTGWLMGPLSKLEQEEIRPAKDAAIKKVLKVLLIMFPYPPTPTALRI